jgi:hypothetical protein
VAALAAVFDEMKLNKETAAANVVIAKADVVCPCMNCSDTRNVCSAPGRSLNLRSFSPPIRV